MRENGPTGDDVHLSGLGHPLADTSFVVSVRCHGAVLPGGTHETSPIGKNGRRCNAGTLGSLSSSQGIVVHQLGSTQPRLRTHIIHLKVPSGTFSVSSRC